MRAPGGTCGAFGALVRRGILPALVVLAAACGDDGTRPEIRPDTTTFAEAREELQAGIPASGTVTLSGRPGRFVVRAPVGQQLRLFLRAQSGRAADTLTLMIKDSAAVLWGWYITSAGSDTALIGRGTDWFKVRTGHSMEVDVSSLRADDSGPFSLLLYMKDPKPEKLAAHFAVGDTIGGEAIDVPGDVDDFYFTAQAGEELLIFLEATTAVGGALSAVVTDSGSTSAIVTAATTGPDSSLLGHGVTRFPVSKTGTYRLHVGGPAFSEDWPFVESEVRGSYRFFIARLNRDPEQVPAVVALGDTSAAETIDLPGDIDEFSFDGTAGTELNLMLQPLSGLAGGTKLDVLYDDSTVASITAQAPPRTLDDAPTGRFTLPSSGRYTVRVQGASGSSPAETVGRYRFELYRIDRRPEHAAVLAPIGTTVVDEALDRPGDIDEFQMPAAPGQHFAIALRVPDGPQPWLCPQVLRGDSLVGWSCAARDVEAYTSMMAAPDTGSYTLRMSASDNFFGRYELEVYPLSQRPETLPEAITLGVPVTGERIDRPMDVDTFTFVATAGQYVNLFLRRDPGYAGQLHALLQPVGPLYSGFWGYDMAWVGFGSMTLDSAHAGRLQLPAGLYKITVDGYSSGEGAAPGTGPYSFLVLPIDPRPEGRIAAFAIGDTVREAIYPSGDIDEYTFQGTAGDRLSLSMRADTSVTTHFCMDVIDPAGNVQSFPYYLGTSRDIDLATTGTYTLRVWHPIEGWPIRFPVVMGDYWFVLTRRT